VIVKFLIGLATKLPLGLFEKGLDYLESKNSTAAAVTKVELETSLEERKAEVSADLEVRKEVAKIKLVDKSRWETRWIRPGFASLIFIYISAILYDSLNIPLWGTSEWSVDAFPESLAWLPLTVVTTYFLARPFEKRKSK
jgi:hypothetical protein